MKYSRVTPGSFLALLGPLGVLSPLAAFAASLAGALLARGVDVHFTERVISTSADGVYSVFATDLDPDGDIDVVSASWIDDKIRWYESDGGKVAVHEIERRQRPSGPWTDAGMAIESEITLSAQERGKEWEYRVIAVNKARPGTPTNTVMVVL